MEKTTSEVEEFQVEKLRIQVHPSREAAGLAAAKATADAMKAIAANRKIFSVIFATGASQIETLKGLQSLPKCAACRLRRL